MSLHWNTVQLLDAPAQPWKNGGGTTQELGRWPAEGDWRWRISVARIEQDGPFSPYPGVQRWFAVLDGAGVLLRVERPGEQGTKAGYELRRLTTQSPPVRFAGSAKVDCTLLAGATRDLNLMVREPGAGMMFRVAGALEFTPVATETIAIYSSGARCTARFGSENAFLLGDELAWLRAAAPEPVRIEADDALCLRIRA